MDYNILKKEVADNIAIITISRPKAMNALNTRFFEEMDAMVEEINNDSSIRAMIISGEGKAFVAGADIAEMVDKNSQQGSDFSRLGQNTFRSLGEMDIPVIAVINGFALGGGLELAMACDFRIAGVKAKFGQPEVNLGLVPGYAGTQRLPRLVGMGDAMYLLMTADMIGAEDALRIGLVQKVFDNEVLMEESLKIAKTITAKGPQAVKKVKMLVRNGLAMSQIDGEELEAKQFGALFGENSEGKEGMSAFLGKRKPEW